MSQKINFNAGPSYLPDVVKHEAQQAIEEFEHSGLSVLELPHRGKHFKKIIEESSELVKELTCLGNDYEVLWLHGGGRMQFAMVPMNFLPQDGCAAYIDSGYWSAQAIKYASYYGNTEVLSTLANGNYTTLPDWPKSVGNQYAYLHLTSNNTIEGTQWKKIPSTTLPLVVDMSSDLFSIQRDFNQFDLIYAAAQKNLGIAGCTMVIVKKSMLTNIVRALPPLLCYADQARENSILNTSPVFSIYVALLMLRWTKAQGLKNLHDLNSRKSNLLYRCIETSKIFSLAVQQPQIRSNVNICFKAANETLEQTFLKFCEERNITGIKGHRALGGFRVSLYNAATLSMTQILVDAIHEFEKQMNL